MDMKKIVISAGLVLSVLFGYGQAKSVISIKNKKLSFQHTVVAKETLTGIAKLYNISLAEISKENDFFWIIYVGNYILNRITFYLKVYLLLFYLILL